VQRIFPRAALASGDVVQLVRTLPCHGRGRGFESRRPRHSFQKSLADFTKTIEGAKTARFAPFCALIRPPMPTLRL
jgi:hypothetical protein